MTTVVFALWRAAFHFTDCIHTLLVASTGDTRDARRAGANTAPWPSKSSATTPAST
jgi:hypothetical protein